MCVCLCLGWGSLIRLKANKSQPNVDRVSAECRQSIDRLAVMLRRLSTDTSVGRHSTDCQPTVYRLSTEMSIECRSRCRSRCRSSIDRRSMEMSIESIDRHSIAVAFNTHDPNNLITKKIRMVQPQPMCAKFEYRNLSRYFSTNSATPPYISTNGTVNTRLLIYRTKDNQYLTKNL